MAAMMFAVVVTKVVDGGLPYWVGRWEDFTFVNRYYKLMAQRHSIKGRIVHVFVKSDFSNRR